MSATTTAPPNFAFTMKSFPPEDMRGELLYIVKDGQVVFNQTLVGHVAIRSLSRKQALLDVHRKEGGVMDMQFDLRSGVPIGQIN